MRTRHMVWANINKVDEKVGEEEEVADGWNGSAWVKSMRGPHYPKVIRIESIQLDCVNRLPVSMYWAQKYHLYMFW